MKGSDSEMSEFGFSALEQEVSSVKRKTISRKETILHLIGKRSRVKERE